MLPYNVKFRRNDRGYFVALNERGAYIGRWIEGSGWFYFWKAAKRD